MSSDIDMPMTFSKIVPKRYTLMAIIFVNAISSHVILTKRWGEICHGENCCVTYICEHLQGWKSCCESYPCISGQFFGTFCECILLWFVPNIEDYDLPRQVPLMAAHSISLLLWRTGTAVFDGKKGAETWIGEEASSSRVLTIPLLDDFSEDFDSSSPLDDSLENFFQFIVRDLIKLITFSFKLFSRRAWADDLLQFPLNDHDFTCNVHF